MSGILEGTSPVEISAEDTKVVLSRDGASITLELHQAEQLLNWLQGFVEQVRESLAEE